MVSPKAFRWNPETAMDNAFMQAGTDESTSLLKVNQEHETLVSTLKARGVEVVLFSHELEDNIPDAVFPNNWFSTHDINGKSTIILYPMKAISRRLERSESVIRELIKTYTVLHNISHLEQQGLFLESTGSLVLDRINHVAYLSISERSHMEAAKEWSKIVGYSLVSFSSTDLYGKAIYHTNVVMSIGTSWALVCSESIADKKERDTVLSSLRDSGRTVIEISKEKAFTYFCANILELQGSECKIVALSKNAFDNLGVIRNKLEQFVTLVPTDIHTIERIGGGSVRCMIAELF